MLENIELQSNMVNKTINSTADVPSVKGFQGPGKGPFYIVLIFLIITENLLVIGAAYMRKRRGIPDILITMISISAIGNAVLVMPIMVYVILYLHQPIWTNWSLCTAQYFFLTTFRQFDIFIITFISVDRYFAVCKPLMYKTRGKTKHGFLVVLLAGCLAMVTTVPPFLGFGAIGRDLQTICIMDWGSSPAVILVMLTYCQFGLVLFCYIKIFKGISSMVNRQRAIEKSQTPTYLKVANKLRQLTSKRSPKESDIEQNSLPNYSVSSTDTVKRLVLQSSSDPHLERDSSRLDHKRSMLTTTNSAGESILSRRKISASHLLKRALLLPRSDSFTSVDSEYNSDSENEMAGMTEEKRRKNIAMDYRKLSEIGLINNALEDDSVFDSSTNNEVFLSPLSAACLTAHTDKRPSKLKKQGRRFSLPDIIDDSTKSNNGHGMSDRYSAARSSTPNLLPGLTKQLSILREHWKKVIVKRSHSQVKRSCREALHFAIIMGMVVFIYYISYLPIAVHVTLWLIVGPAPAVRSWGFFARSMTLLSPVLIPVVYGLMCKPYRKNYKRILAKVFCVKYFLKVMKKQRIVINTESIDS